MRNVRRYMPGGSIDVAGDCCPAVCSRPLSGVGAPVGVVTLLVGSSLWDSMAKTDDNAFVVRAISGEFGSRSTDQDRAKSFAPRCSHQCAGVSVSAEDG